jgi:Ca2+-binding RTX toxin-like protein
MGDDVIVGGGGADDVVDGLGGSDPICLDPEATRYAVVYGGAGNDRILASGYLHGEVGHDKVTNPLRSSASELLVGGPGDDVLRSRGLRSTSSARAG